MGVSNDLKSDGVRYNDFKLVCKMTFDLLDMYAVASSFHPILSHFLSY